MNRVRASSSYARASSTSFPSSVKAMLLPSRVKFYPSPKTLTSPFVSTSLRCLSTCNSARGCCNMHTLPSSQVPPHSKRTAHCLSECTLPSKQRPVKAAHLHSKRTAPLAAGGSYKPAQHSAHTTAQFIASAFQNRRWRTRAKLKGRYWCTLKSKHRTVRIQLHRRVTVVLPAPAV